MKTLAIIGTGISGLGCAHLLQGRFDLTLFEQNSYAGGHTNTVTVEENGRELPVDTGFMVFNHQTYPNLTRLFRELGVPTKPTSMSFSVRDDPSGTEYNGGSLNLLFGQRRNLLRPRHWRLLLTIHRFNQEAMSALRDPRYAAMTLGDYVAERGYGTDFLSTYLLPMSSAVWSTPPGLMLRFPAMTLLRFWYNHGFLGLHTQHPWFTVDGGAASYVRRLTAPFRDRIHLGHRVTRVERRAGRVRLGTEQGGVGEFDKVVLACHGDQALELLADATDEERTLLKCFRYHPNTATLHTDERFMPRTRRCWASWNYRISSAGQPSTHYWMNSLQGVSRTRNYFVSLNCHDEVDPASVLKRIEYRHPLFDLEAIQAQTALPSLNRRSPDQTTYFAGAWFKYGFHEDGFTSGLECARAITGEPLWS